MHSAPINYVQIEEDALQSLPEILRSVSYIRPFLLYDSTTYAVAGEAVRLILDHASLPHSQYILEENEPTPDEIAIGRILIHFDRSCDILIAVGSGTLNDLARFISYQLKLPYIIIATAPSMDGFASNVAPLIVNHMKTTYEAHTPAAILGDTKLTRTAPMNMISAGIGDILGKYTCLCEWEIAHQITGEYHCSTIEGIVRISLETVVANIDKACSRSTEAINSIMEALVLSGIAMSFAGNSRPASGSEHHLSHYWEMMFLFQGKKPVLHGTKVGIGTIAVMRAYEILMSMDIDFNKAREHAKRYSQLQWEALIKETYGQAAASVIALEKEHHKNDPVNVLSRIELMERHWNKLREAVSHMPSSNTVRDYLTTLEAPASPMSVGIDRDTFLNSFRVAKELRNRFGLLQILFDLGLTDEIANQVWEYFQ
jgi:glycerol-1-phosphate dehydrogenase [NAD(P)+]